MNDQRSKKTTKESTQPYKKIIATIVAVLSLVLVIFMSYVDMKAPKLLNQQQYDLQAVIKENHDAIKANQKKNVDKANYEHNVKTATTQEFVNARRHYKESIQENMIGNLQIPSVGIDLPIFSGMDNDSLLNGVGTFSKDRKMGKGNYVMMAHNLPSKYSNSLLEPLINIKENAKIKVTDFNKVYTYKAFYKHIVDQKEVEFLGQTHAKVVTLFRCVGQAGTTQRLMVQGRLVKTENLAKSKNKSVKKSTKKLAINHPTNAEKMVMASFNYLDFTGEFSQDWLQFALALIPLVVVLLITGFAFFNEKNK
jgi:sortase A